VDFKATLNDMMWCGDFDSAHLCVQNVFT